MQCCGIRYRKHNDGRFYLTISGEVTHDDPRTLESDEKTFTVVAVGNNAFPGQNTQLSFTGVTKIVIQDNVIAIGDSAFQGCTNVTSLSFPDSLTTIGEGAFVNDPTMPSEKYWDLKIGPNLVNLGNSPFGSTNIKSFIVDPGNKYLSVDENTGVLYGNGGTDLIQAPTSVGENGSGFTVPNDVEIIRSTAFYNCTIDGDLTIGKNVVSIDYFAFCRCKINGSIIFDENSKLKSIEDYAFHNCILPESDGEATCDLTIPDSVINIGCNSFDNCKIRNLTIGKSVKWIGDHAFETSGENPGTISSITLGESVSFIGVAAFGNCSDFSDDFTLVIPKSVECICESAFYGKLSYNLTIKFECSKPIMAQKCFSFSENGKTIDFKADWATSADFDYFIVSNSVSVKVNGTEVPAEGSTDIFEDGDFTFKMINKSNCVRVVDYKGDGVDIVIPSTATKNNETYTVTGIEYQFSGLSGSVTLPTTLTTITGPDANHGAFEGCDDLTGELKIPSHITRLGINTFSLCEGFTSLTFEDGCQLKYIPGKAFNWCSSIDGTVTIPGSVKVIGFVSMRGMINVDHVNIGANVEMICGRSFEDCYELENITFDDNLEYIGFYALKGSGLSHDITIPSKVKYIGTSAFASGGDMNGKTMTFKGDEPILGASSLFFGYNNTEYKTIEIKVVTNGWGDDLGSRVLGIFANTEIVINDDGNDNSLIIYGSIAAVLVILAAAVAVYFLKIRKP